MTHRLYVNEDGGQVSFVLHRGEGVVPGLGAPQPFASPFQTSSGSRSRSSPEIDIRKYLRHHPATTQ